MTQAPSPAIEPLRRGLTEFEQGGIDIFVRLADMLGLPKSVGEIYGLLFVSARPLAFQDIVERLNMSKGSASQGLRFLRTTGAIKLTYLAGNRRDHFVPETELRALISGFLREKIQPHLESGLLRIEALSAMGRSPAFAEGNAEDARVLRKRMEKLRAWHKRGGSLVPIVTKLFG